LLQQSVCDRRGRSTSSWDRIAINNDSSNEAKESTASHHLDSPIARQDVRLDITHLYLFRDERGTAFVINVCHTIAGQIPVPGFHPEGMYEFQGEGDAVAVAVEELAIFHSSTGPTTGTKTGQRTHPHFQFTLKANGEPR